MEGNPRIALSALHCSIGSKCSTLNVTWSWSSDGGKASLAHNRRLRMRVPGSIKMVDHHWLWHGVLTRMVVLEDRPRIVASLDTITTVEDGYKAKDKDTKSVIYSKYDSCSELDEYS